MLDIALGVGMFTAIVLILVFIILIARAWLVTTGEVTITVNGEATYRIPAGAKLSDALSTCGLYISTACGGGGTCGQCRVKVLGIDAPLLPTEATHITKREAAEGERVADPLPLADDDVGALRPRRLDGA